VSGYSEQYLLSERLPGTCRSRMAKSAFSVIICLERMRPLLITCVVVGLLASASAQSASDSHIEGAWEGESKCTVAGSPCHDEQALYRISADKQAPSQLKIDAYKIVAGTPEFMGALICHYTDGTSAFTCTANTPRHDEWKFHLEDNILRGTLTLDNGATLYRRVVLHRSSSNENPKK
jgi:hypothetical protein